MCLPRTNHHHTADKEAEMLKPIALSIVAIALLPSQSAQAASFDCSRARTPTEIAICANPEVSSLDEDLAGLYRSLLNQLPAHQADQVRQEQRSWIKARNSCGADIDCLRARYEERSARLGQY